jgi:uncharacterized membrane protein
MMRGLFLAGVAAVVLAGCGEPIPALQTAGDESAPAPAAEAAALKPASLAELQGPLAALGTEPFWRLEIGPESGVVLTQADAEEAIEAPYVPPEINGASGRIVSGALTVELALTPCSDGMSEADYPISARVIVTGGPDLKGCAFRPWATDLGRFVTAIDRCLDARVEQAAVLYAEIEDGVTTVRLSGAGGARSDCRVARDGGVSFEPTPQSVRHASEGQPIFHRAKDNQVVELCEGQEQAKDAAGRVLGWYGLAPNCEGLDAAFEDALGR